MVDQATIILFLGPNGQLFGLIHILCSNQRLMNTLSSFLNIFFLIFFYYYLHHNSNTAQSRIFLLKNYDMEYLVLSNQGWQSSLQSIDNSLMIKLIVGLLVLLVANAQYCISQEGEPIEWWIVLKVPPKIGNSGFAYYDSNTKTGKMMFYDENVDINASALTMTISAFNGNNYEVVAWNDEKPNGSTSSTAAHSKGFIGYSYKNNRGFFISHSIPKYPNIQNSQIDPIIQISQQFYGQHLACLSLSLKELDDIAAKLLIIRPNVYTDPVSNLPASSSLYRLSLKQFPATTSLFEIYDFRSVFGYGIKAIFKHHNINGSIFEDGLTRYLSVSPILAETWMRPFEPAWCSEDYEVKNVRQIKINDYTWFQADDHSKWVLASQDFFCLGDMNRMQSQWKRGGAFYCFNDLSLIRAIQGIIVQSDSCSVSQ